MKSILDNSFRYTPSSQTDVGATFARLRLEQRQAELTRVQAIVAQAHGNAAHQARASKSNKA